MGLDLHFHVVEKDIRLSYNKYNKRYFKQLIKAKRCGRTLVDIGDHIVESFIFAVYLLVCNGVIYIPLHIRFLLQ